MKRTPEEHAAHIRAGMKKAELRAFEALAPQAISKKVMKMLKAQAQVSLDELIAAFEADIADAGKALLLDANQAALRHLLVLREGEAEHRSMPDR